MQLNAVTLHSQFFTELPGGFAPHKMTQDDFFSPYFVPLPHGILPFARYAFCDECPLTPHILAFYRFIVRHDQPCCRRLRSARTNHRPAGTTCATSGGRHSRNAATCTDRLSRCLQAGASGRTTRPHRFCYWLSSSHACA